MKGHGAAAVMKRICTPCIKHRRMEEGPTHYLPHLFDKLYNVDTWIALQNSNQCDVVSLETYPRRC